MHLVNDDSIVFICFIFFWFVGVNQNMAQTESQERLLHHLKQQGPVVYSPDGVVASIFHCVSFFEENMQGWDLQVLTDLAIQTIRQHYNEADSSGTEIEALVVLIDMTCPQIMKQMMMSNTKQPFEEVQAPTNCLKAISNLCCKKKI
jgi:hypothetical protein